MKHNRKIIFGLLLILCLMLPLFANVSKADTGPKPSIVINVKNAPEDYFIALLEQDADDWGNIGDDQKKYFKENYPGEKEQQALDTLFAYDVDRWQMHITPTGAFAYRSAASGTYRFGYMVPQIFRVIIVTLDGEIITSSAAKKKSFNAVYDYDVATGEITEIITESCWQYALNVIANYALTLSIEGILFVLFGFAVKKKNWLHFLIINTVTQIALNVWLVLTVGNGWYWYDVFEGLVTIEIGILIVEAVYYAITLRGKDNTPKRRRSLLYGLVANATSFLLGYMVLYNLWMKFYEL